MPSWLYQIAATTIAAVRPSLFRYKADAGARRGVRVTQSCDTIDIVKDDRAIRLNRSNWAYVPDMINSFDYFHGSAGPVTVRCRGWIDTAGRFLLASPSRGRRFCGILAATSGELWETAANILLGDATLLDHAREAVAAWSRVPRLGNASALAPVSRR
jgi:hypothetical protein